jgi:hypothetical protein
MRSLLLKSAGLACAVFATILAAYVLLPQSRYAAMAALIDKETLLKTAAGPRVIFVGGSSVAFGIDSARVKDALGNRYAAVVNTGLHGGLGLAFMLAFVRPYLQPGDLLVLAPEYSLLYDLHPDKTALNQALGEYPPAWRYVSLGEGVEPGAIMLTVQNRVKRWLGLIPEAEDPIYTRRGFNAYGDLISHIDRLPEREIDAIKLGYTTPAQRPIRILNEFFEYCRANHVEAVLTFAPYPRELAGKGTSADVWLEQMKALTPIPVISHPEDYRFPQNLFFDTVYHLNADGRQARTKQLIMDLRRALSTPLGGMAQASP